MNANWNYPTAIRVGAGRLPEVAAACKELGIKAPLLVTDPGLADLPMVQQAVSACANAGLDCAVFSAIKANPTGSNVAATGQGTLIFRLSRRGLGRPLVFDQ